MGANDPHVMLSPKDVAQRFGISTAAVSKAVKKLVAEHSIPVEYDSRGRVALVSLAHYERYRGRYLNPAKARAKTEAEASNDSFDEARRQAEWLKVDREKLRRAEELGNLVRRDMLVEALERCGREIQARVGRIANRADDVAPLIIVIAGYWSENSSSKGSSFPKAGHSKSRLDTWFG